MVSQLSGSYFSPHKHDIRDSETMSYGIIPIHQKDQVSTKAMFTAAVRMLRQKGYLGEEEIGRASCRERV